MSLSENVSNLELVSDMTVGENVRSEAVDMILLDAATAHQILQVTCSTLQRLYGPFLPEAFEQQCRYAASAAASS